MGAETSGTVQVMGGGRRRAEHLAMLSLAMIAGVIGFVLVIFWGIALILMGVLWGMMAMERQRVAESEKGVLAELVDVVVDAAKDVASRGSRHEASDDPPRRVTSRTESRVDDAPGEPQRRRVASSTWSPFDGSDDRPRRATD
jgi:hypothetical protein